MPKRNKKIVFIVQADSKNGLGHFYRSRNLALEMIRHTGERNLLFYVNNPKLLKSICPDVIKLIRCNNFEELGHKIKDSDIIIVDIPSIKQGLIRDLKINNIDCKIIVFGTKQVLERHVDVLIDNSMGKMAINGKAFRKDFIKLFGPKYIFLEKNFLINKNSYKFRNSLNKIFVMFGGSDPLNLTYKVLKKIISEKNDFNIEVSVGNGYKFWNRLCLLEKNEKIVSITKNNKSVYKSMMRSDFFIGSPGTCLYESYAIGIPGLFFLQNEKQGKDFKLFPNIYHFNNKRNFTNLCYSTYKDYGNFKDFLKKTQVCEGCPELIRKIFNSKK